MRDGIPAHVSAYFDALLSRLDQATAVEFRQVVVAIASLLRRSTLVSLSVRIIMHDPDRRLRVGRHSVVCIVGT
jgi:hypothetical protein